MDDEEKWKRIEEWMQTPEGQKTFGRMADEAVEEAFRKEAEKLYSEPLIQVGESPLIKLIRESVEAASGHEITVPPMLDMPEWHDPRTTAIYAVGVDGTQPVICPNCHEQNTLEYIGHTLLGTYTLCFSCGNRWR